MEHHASLSIHRAELKESDILNFIEAFIHISGKNTPADQDSRSVSGFEIHYGDKGRVEGNRLIDLKNKLPQLHKAKSLFLSVKNPFCNIKMVLEASPENVSVIDISCQSSERLASEDARFKEIISGLSYRPSSEIYRPTFITLLYFVLLVASMMAWSLLSLDILQNAKTQSIFYQSLISFGILFTLVPAYIGMRALNRFKSAVLNAYTLLGPKQRDTRHFKSVCLSSLLLLLWPTFILGFWLFHKGFFN